VSEPGRLEEEGRVVDRQARRLRLLLLPCFVVLSGLVWILRGGVGWGGVEEAVEWSGICPPI